MPAEPSDPEKILDSWIPTYDEPSVWSQGPEPCPTLVYADAGKSREEPFNFLRQQFLDTLFGWRVARRQLLLIARAKKQALSLGPKVNVVRYIPDKRPSRIDPIDRRRDEEMAPAGP
jgi:hypothetical protein